MQYRWQAIRFDCPEGRDDSNILIVDPAAPPRWNLSVRVDELPTGPGGLLTYVAGLPVPTGANLTGKSTRTVAGRDATTLKYELKLQDGTVLRQQQALVADATRVHIFTITAAATAEGSANAAFEKLLSTLIWEKP